MTVPDGVQIVALSLTTEERVDVLERTRRLLACSQPGPWRQLLEAVEIDLVDGGCTRFARQLRRLGPDLEAES